MQQSQIKPEFCYELGFQVCKGTLTIFLYQILSFWAFKNPNSLVTQHNNIDFLNKELSQLRSWYDLIHIQYYFYDFTLPLLQLPPINNLQYFYFPPQKTLQTQISFINDKAQQACDAVEVLQCPKIKQDQKMISQKCIFVQNKNFHIISKKSKIKKINFVDKRNIIPNNINHILAFVQRKSKSQKLIGKIIRKQKNQYQPYNTKVFYSYQAFLKNKLSVHVNTKALEIATTHLDYQTQVFGVDEQLFYNRISRIAILFYLKNIAPLVSLHSQRLKNTFKKDHLKVQRYLLNLLESLCYQQIQEEILEKKEI